MKNGSVTLVEPKQIAKKGYTGCKTGKAVVNFAKKHGVPCLWYKPQNGQKVLLVEMNQFGTTWKQVQHGHGTTSSSKHHGTYATGNSKTGTGRKTGRTTGWNNSTKKYKSTSKTGTWKKSGKGTSYGTTSRSTSGTTKNRSTKSGMSAWGKSQSNWRSASKRTKSGAKTTRMSGMKSWKRSTARRGTTARSTSRMKRAA